MKVLHVRLLYVLVFVILICVLIGGAFVWFHTTKVTISNTVETNGMDRPGINLGGLGNYGAQQLFKSLNYASGGYFPGTYAGTTYSCSSGGSNTTTTWYNSITNGSGYPENFWVGARYVAINAATGSSYGSGTVTASTSNQGSMGTTFTLDPALSAPCSPSQKDVLIVRQLSVKGMLAPNQLFKVCSEATWNTSDTSPDSSNTQHCLAMPAGCELTFYLDATVTNRTNTNASLASQQVSFINLNGSYHATFKAKCLVAGCSVNFNLGRFGSCALYVGSTTVNPSDSGTPGAGWTTYNYPFTAAETGAQSNTIGYSFTCTGTCLIQDADVVEGSTLSGNTTVFRDAVVSELQHIHPGVDSLHGRESVVFRRGRRDCGDGQPALVRSQFLQARRGPADGLQRRSATGAVAGRGCAHFGWPAESTTGLEHADPVAEYVGVDLEVCCIGTQDLSGGRQRGMEYRYRGHALLRQWHGLWVYAGVEHGGCEIGCGLRP